MTFFVISNLFSDSKSCAIDSRDFREEFIQFGLSHEIAIILHIVHDNKIYCYDQPFERFGKKAHQVFKPECLTRHSGAERFTVGNGNPDQKDKNLNILEYLRHWTLNYFAYPRIWRNFYN